MHVLNNGRMSLGTGSVGGAKRDARPGDRGRQGPAPVRSPPGRLRTGRGQDRLDGVLPVRARVDGVPDDRHWSTPGCPTTRPSRRSARSPRASSPGTRPTARCSSPAERAICATGPTRRSCATCGSCRSSRARTTCCASFVALSGLKPLGDELKGLRASTSAIRSVRLRLLLEYVGGRDPAGRDRPLGRATRNVESLPHRGVARSRRAIVGVAAAQARRTSERQFSSTSSRTRWRHLRADRCCRGRLILEDPTGRPRDGSLHAETFCTRATRAAWTVAGRVAQRASARARSQARLQATARTVAFFAG